MEETWEGQRQVGGEETSLIELLSLSLSLSLSPVCPQLRSTDGYDARGARCWRDWDHRRWRHDGRTVAWVLRGRRRELYAPCERARGTTNSETSETERHWLLGGELGGQTGWMAANRRAGRAAGGQARWAANMQARRDTLKTNPLSSSSLSPSLFALNCCLPSTAVCPQLLFALDYCLPSTVFALDYWWPY